LTDTPALLTPAYAGSIPSFKGYDCISHLHTIKQSE
jgi:hypothetical protein